MSDGSQRRHGMRDEDKQSGLAALLMMLLMGAGAAAANGDVRLVEAVRTQDRATVRTC